MATQRNNPYGAFNFLVSLGDGDEKLEREKRETGHTGSPLSGDATAGLDQAIHPLAKKVHPRVEPGGDE